MEIVNINGIAVVRSDNLILTDTQSALDLIADASYHAESSRIIIFKENIVEGFFNLSTGLLGEVLQKFVTYKVQLAIVGDFSKYTSKPLHAFILESNMGSQICFVANEQAAFEKLKAK